MILASHALIGAAAARVFTSNPILAFIMGMISHYLADAVPHWQYERLSIMNDKNSGKKKVFSGKGFLRDILFIGLDFSFGMLTSIYFFWADGSGGFPVAIALGAFGGMFPDALQLLNSLMPKGLFKLHQAFHDLVHTKHELKQGSISGVLLQIIIVTACVFVSQEIK